jgi:regulator of sigma E protease
VDSVAAARLPEGARALETLSPGDRIERINGDSVRTWDEVVRALITGPAQLRFDVAGRQVPIVVRLDQGGLPARQAVAEALIPRIPVTVKRLEPGRPAARAGLQPGDVIVAVDGVPLRSVEHFLGRVWESPETPLRLDVLRRGERLTFTVVPERATGTDKQYPKRPPSYGLIGAELERSLVRVQRPVGEAIVRGWDETRQTAVLVVQVLKGLVLREVSVKDVGGPIFVAQASGQAARLGFDWLLRFMAFFSVNLAVLNLLPIPILDGGQVVFLLAEAVRRKPLPLELRLRLTQIGFVLLLGLMILVTSNDILRSLGNVFRR